jgi:hypothetical protein
MPLLLRGWKEHRLRVELPGPVVDAMLQRARQYDVEAGGRFTVRNGRTVVLWSADEHPDGGRAAPIATIDLTPCQPGAGAATIWRLAWDPEASSCDEVCRAVELLVGAP